MKDNDNHTPNNTEPDEIQVPEWQVERIVEKRVKEENLEDYSDGDFQLSEDPESQIQGIIKNIYEILRDNPKPDAFDKFYENSELEEYTHKHLVVEFIQKCFKRLEISNSDIQDINELDEEELKTEKMDKALKSIAEGVNSESELKAIEKIIKEDYEDLVSNERTSMSAEEYKAKRRDFIEREVREDLAKVDSIEETEFFNSEYFEEFRAMNEHQIDEVSKECNKMVDIGVDNWKLHILALVSAPLDKFQKNGMPTRSSIHVCDIGDISTGKSGIINICKAMSENYDAPSKMTDASFEGAYKDGEIKDGIVDRINNGNLFIEEYDKIDKDEGNMRIVFDNGEFNINKNDQKKVISPVNTSLIVGANPENDFFLEQTKNMREQIPFTEGEMSRFDVIIPQINSEEDMETITQETTLFGGSNNVELNELKKAVQGRIAKAKSVDKVIIEPEVEQEIKDAFLKVAQEIDFQSDNRPKLIIQRDNEILLRLVYVLSVIENEITEGKVEVKSENVEEAVALFEHIIKMRKRLYEENTRDELKVDTDKAMWNKLVELNGTTEQDGVKKSELIKQAQKDDIINNKQNGYYHVRKMISNEKAVPVNPDKERNQRIRPVR